MIVAKQISEFPKSLSVTTGFVPTMGALHSGHLALIERAAKENERVVVSIFVNPTQFGPNEDFSKYPRPFERDCELAEKAGATVIFAPTPKEMFPEHPSLIHVPVVGDHFEGAFRPGHFDGVATIVSKLFNIVQPTRAYFGKKDLQQCAVVQKMVRDLNHSVDLILCDTLREIDGLAKSSRNVYLSPEERTIAPNIFRILQETKVKIDVGFEPENVVIEAKTALNNLGFKVDYFELVDWSEMSATRRVNDDSYLVVAAKLGKTRLIDNLKILG